MPKKHWVLSKLGNRIGALVTDASMITEKRKCAAYSVETKKGSNEPPRASESGPRRGRSIEHLEGTEGRGGGESQVY